MSNTGTRTRIFGILNVTRDSFSDGGRFLEPDAAVAHGRRLARDGADVIDVGAEATHPDAERIGPDEETARLVPVVERLRAEGLCVSVDTYKAPVMRRMVALGVAFINDVTALRDPESVAAVRDANVQVILMHSVAAGAHADRRDIPPETIVERIVAFFERRLAELEAAGVTRERLILDPGMGFFLGRCPEASLAVLRGLKRLTALGRPVLVSTSRKSFIGAVLGRPGQPRPPSERSAGTLATELWAAAQGAAYIRTHDVRALRDALTLWEAVTSGRTGSVQRGA